MILQETRSIFIATFSNTKKIPEPLGDVDVNVEGSIERQSSDKDKETDSKRFQKDTRLDTANVADQIRELSLTQGCAEVRLIRTRTARTTLERRIGTTAKD